MAALSLLSILALAAITTCAVRPAPTPAPEIHSPEGPVVKAPRGRTPVANLAPSGLRHHEVLRIDQEGLHPDEAYEIVLDGWTALDLASEIHEVRLWWINTGQQDERSNFGRGVTSAVDIEYQVESRSKWNVSLSRGKRSWVFEVELDPTGGFGVTGDVRDKHGKRLERCQIKSSRMVPSRLLGLVAGIDRIEVECVDTDSQSTRGELAVHER